MANVKAKAKIKEVELDQEVQVQVEKKLGINELSEALNIKPASARVRLRGAGIKKVGRSYEWTQEEFDNVIAELKADDVPAPVKEKATKAKKLKAVAQPVSDEDDVPFFNDNSAVDEEY
jgi:hypothetical protein